MSYTGEKCSYCEQYNEDEGVDVTICGFEKYTICTDCVHTVRSELKLARFPNYMCFVEHRLTSDREIFDDAGELDLFMQNREAEDYSFGRYLNPNWDPVSQNSFLGEDFCGISEQETLSLLENFANLATQDGNVIMVVGWRGHGPSSEEDFESSLLKIVVYSVEQGLREIEEYSKKNGLAETPFMIAAYGGFAPISPSQLRSFCFPDLDQNLQWYDNYSAFSQAKREVKLEHGVWAATHSFLEHEIYKIDTKIGSLAIETLKLQNLKNRCIRIRQGT